MANAEKRDLSMIGFGKKRSPTSIVYTAGARVTRNGDTRVTRNGDTRVIHAIGYALTFQEPVRKRDLTMIGWSKPDG